MVKIKYRKIIFLNLLLVIGLLFSGCNNSSSSNGSSNSFGLNNAFSGGNEALTIKLTNGQPPDKIKDGGIQPFTIRAIIQNKGEYTIPANKTHIVLTGIKLSDFNLSSGVKNLSEVRGVNKTGTTVINGGIYPVIFSGLKYMPQLVSGSMKQNILIDLCYPYKTRSLIVLCISGDTLQNNDDNLKVCSIESNRPYANSGAPVMIENVKEMSAGQHKISFQFDIVSKSSQNSNSRIYKSGSLDDNCQVNGNSVSSTNAQIYENYINYTVDTGIPNLDCSGSGSNKGVVLLQNGKATVYCTQDLANQNDYQKPIKVTLSYDYFDRLVKEIEIDHAP